MAIRAGSQAKFAFDKLQSEDAAAAAPTPLNGLSRALTFSGFTEEQLQEEFTPINAGDTNMLYVGTRTVPDITLEFLFDEQSSNDDVEEIFKAKFAGTDPPNADAPSRTLRIDLGPTGAKRFDIETRVKSRSFAIVSKTLTKMTVVLSYAGGYAEGAVA